MYQVYPVLEPAAQHFDYCADLYARLRFEKNGRIDPYSRDYTAGGVHFNRSAEWFANQLSLPGAKLICVNNDQSQLCGYTLFFTDENHFPSFADDCLQYRGIEGNTRGLAYTYLIAVEPIDRKIGLGWRLMEMERQIAWQAGCGLIAHEFFVRPRVNVTSAAFHLQMEKRWGAADTGRTASHHSEELGSSIVYSQYLIPTQDNRQVLVRPDGTIVLN